MRWVRGFALVAVVSVVGACSGRSVRNAGDDEAGGGAGAPSEGGTTGASSGAGGTIGLGGSSPTGGAPSGGTSAAGAPTGGTSMGGTSMGGMSMGGTSMGGTGASGPGCVPQQATGVGACEISLGVFFTGGSCASISGCSCEGEDCDAAHVSVEACVQTHRGCVVGCVPQDATVVGSCEPLPHVVFTGVDCVDMTGCECIGDDCDATYMLPTPDPGPPSSALCESAHANCAVTPRSCDEIADVYEAYASRSACQEDSDCHVAHGHCSIGIGPCYSVMNAKWPVEGLDALAVEWQNAGCMGPVCDCLPAPTVVQCDDGVCVGSP